MLKAKRLHGKKVSRNFIAAVGGAIFIVGFHSPLVCRAATEKVEPAAAYDPKVKELNEAPILARGVHGEVTVATDGATPVALKNGEKLKQGCVVRTGKKSTVDLIFSNGTVLALDADTVLGVDEFLQAGGYDVSAPLRDGKTVIDHKIPRIGEMDKEPSYSKTKIFLREGTMYAQVKHLHKKSTFLVGNPLGVSKILGTTWKQAVTTDLKKLEKMNKILLQEGLIEFHPIESKDKPHDSIFIHPQEEVNVSGFFGSEEAMNRVTTTDSVNLDVNVDVNVNINVERQPIRDPEFPALVAAFLPQDRDDQIAPTGPEQQGQGLSDASDLGAISTGDPGVGTIGTQIGGSGGGGGSTTTNNNNNSNGGNNPPAS
ncbi:hypothetical protein BH09VER1_BH09VER1_24350 [soil metagenome]